MTNLSKAHHRSRSCAESPYACKAHCFLTLSATGTMGTAPMACDQSG